MDQKIVLLFLTFIFKLASFAIIDGEINMFIATDLTVELPRGVWRTSSHPLRFQFGVVKNHLMTNEYTARFVANEINEGSTFTISSHVELQEHGSEATLISANDKNGDRLYFKVSLMKRRDKLRLSFSYLTSELKTTTMKAIATKVQASQRIAVKVNQKDNEVSFYVDGKKIKREDLVHALHVIPTANVDLRLAQQYHKSGHAQNGKIGLLFKGILGDTKMKFDTKQSSGQSDTCVCDDGKGGPLKNGCVLDGIRYKENTEWTKDECNICSCKKGQVTCVHHCSVCKVDGKMYLHGDIWDSKDKDCTRCQCISGKIKCDLPVICPKPNCEGKSGDVVTLPGQCCPICKEDQCIGTGKEFRCDCPRTCFNHKSYSCSKATCKEGCYCPKMIVQKLQRLENEHGVCVSLRECPCKYKGKIYQSGEWLPPSEIGKNDGCAEYRCQNGDMGPTMGCEK